MIKILKDLIMGLSILVLGSCSLEEKVELNKMLGDQVVLKVEIDGIKEKVPISRNTKSVNLDTLIGVSELGNGLMLESRLRADVPVTGTKFGGGNNLNSNSKILAMVYKLDGTPYKYQYLSTSKAEVMLPLGHSFKIVFYSYNSDVEPKIELDGGTATEDGNGGFTVPAGASFKDITEVGGTHALFARIENTGVISQMTKLPNILFTPLFSRIRWVLYNDLAATVSVSDAKLNSAYADAVIHTSKIQNLTTLQELWDGIGTADKIVDLNFAQTNGAHLTSDKHIFIPDEANVTTLSSTINLMNISYSLDKLERGVSYNVMSKIVNKKYNVAFSSAENGSVSLSGIVEGAMGETVSSTATADPGYIFNGWYDGQNKVETTSGEVSVSGTSITVQLTSSTNTKSFVANFKKFDPDELGDAAPHIYIVGTGDEAILLLTKDPKKQAALFQYGSVIGWRNGELTARFNPSRYLPSDQWDENWEGDALTHDNWTVRAGKGDPCKLVGKTVAEIKKMIEKGEIPDSGWRMPTKGENDTYAAGTNKWDSTMFGYWFSGEFLPASGYRPARGGYAEGGTAYSPGGYWSSTIDRYSGGAYVLYFSSAGFSNYGHDRAMGYSVRCVR